MKNIGAWLWISVFLVACQNGTSGSGARFDGSPQGQGGGKSKSDPLTRDCRGGVDGPAGMINGQKLKSGSRLARHTVWVQLLTPGQNGQSRMGSCSGSLVAPNLILTAAHCFQDISAQTTGRVYFGTDALCEESQNLKPIYREITEVSTHPNFDMNSNKDKSPATEQLAYDLALVKIRTGAPESHEPIALIKDFPGLKDSDQVFTAGFGKDTPGDQPAFEDLMLRYESFVGTQNFGESNNRKSPLLHIKNPQSFACKGDSGGPSFIATSKGLRQLGVTSVVLFAQKAEACTDSTAIVNISLHQAWITDSARELTRNPDLILFD